MDTVTPSAWSAAKLERLSTAIERLDSLDPFASALLQLADRLLPEGRLRDWASGVPLVHPLHPMLVGVPIGSWTTASWLDLRGGNRVAARKLVGFGLVAAVPTLVSGVNDWLTTAQAERRVGLVHALAKSAAMLAYGASWLARWRGYHRVPDVSAGVDRCRWRGGTPWSGDASSGTHSRFAVAG